MKMRQRQVLIFVVISVLLASVFITYSLIKFGSLSNTDGSILLLHQCELALRKEKPPIDFLQFAEDLNLIKSYYEGLQTGKGYTNVILDEVQRSQLERCIVTLEKKILPWVDFEKKSIWPWVAEPQSLYLRNLNSTFGSSQRGIVICSGNKLFDFAIHLIRGLLSFPVDLPIVVAYAGNDDLSPAKQAYLHDMGVGTLDITKYFDNSILKLQGFATKPFAILAAEFQEVLFLDADAVMLQDPTKMFNDIGYLKEGLLLQKDRALHLNWKRQKLWLTSNLAQPLSEGITGSEMFQGFTDHQVDSSLIVIDKKRRIFSLLAACKLNMFEEKQNFYSNFYGDKESFWIGTEMSHETYSFLPHLPGVFGRFFTDEADKLCGRQLMFDRSGVPLYFNEGVVKDKSKPVGEREIMKIPTHYEYAGRWWESKEGDRCFFTKGIEIPPKLLSTFQLVMSTFQHVDIE
jgi:hypothetical protein